MTKLHAISIIYLVIYLCRHNNYYNFDNNTFFCYFISDIIKAQLSKKQIVVIANECFFNTNKLTKTVKTLVGS